MHASYVSTHIPVHSWESSIYCNSSPAYCSLTGDQEAHCMYPRGVSLLPVSFLWIQPMPGPWGLAECLPIYTWSPSHCLYLWNTAYCLYPGSIYLEFMLPDTLESILPLSQKPGLLSAFLEFFLLPVSLESILLAASVPGVHPTPCIPCVIPTTCIPGVQPAACIPPGT